MFGTLFALSENFEESLNYQKGLKAISDLFASNQEFKNMLLNPSFKDNEKLDVIKEIIPEYYKDAKFAEWLTELVRRNRIGEIEEISDEYSRLNNSLNEKVAEVKEKFPEYGKNSSFTNFLTELLRKDKVEQIESMEGNTSGKSSNKELKIKIIVASELSDEQLKGIVNKFKDMYKAETVQYTIEIDKSIIGGIKVCVGNTIYDNTIDTRLRQIF
ncbi:MAG: F0F1 ATP synthase subunit delta [Clostridia bacterium]|nr:F0F1 ATP synthase subunit delta [Clostridia bacterium]